MSAAYVESFADAYGAAVGARASEFPFGGKIYATSYARHHLKWLRANIRGD